MRATDRHAFTLAESLLAAVVLAIAVIAVSATLSASQAHVNAIENGSRAASLARQLMEEIAAKPFVAVDATPGWPGVTSRASYDTVNDYDGYTDTTPLPMLDGEPSGAGGAGFTRSVTFHYPATLFGTTPHAGDFVIVDVAVRDPSGVACTLRRLFAQVDLDR